MIILQINFIPGILPLEADLHGEREHHVDRVDPVDVENVDPLLHDDRLVGLPLGHLPRSRWVLEIGLGHNHLEIRRKLLKEILGRNRRTSNSNTLSFQLNSSWEIGRSISHILILRNL